jgi:hypothetical protein
MPAQFWRRPLAKYWRRRVAALLAAAGLASLAILAVPAVPAFAGLGTPQAGPFPVGNLLSYANSDFEGTPVNYISVSNATLSQSTVKYLHSHSLRDTVAAAGTSSFKLQEGTGPTQINVTNPATYTIGGYFKLSSSAAGQTVQFSLGCYDSTGKWIGWQDTPVESLAGATTWQYAEGQVTVPSGCANVQDSPKVTLGGMAASETVNLDEFVFKSYRGAETIGAHGDACADGSCHDYTAADWLASDSTGSSGIGPLQIDKEFIPAGSGLSWPGTVCKAIEGGLPQSQWPICIVAYMDQVSQATMTAFMQAIPAAQQVILVYHQEPEGDSFSGSCGTGGPEFVCEWNAQYAEYQTAGDFPNITMVMNAGSFQYKTGNTGAGCSFLPPGADVDGYAIDFYEQTVDGNNVASNVNRGDAWTNWTNCILNTIGNHKPIGMFEQGYDQGTTSNQQNTPTAIVADQSYLENYPASHGQPVNWWNYWWSDYGGAGGSWRFDNTYGAMNKWKANETANGGA